MIVDLQGEVGHAATVLLALASNDTAMTLFGVS
jgi:hypothetical protein